MKEVTTAELFVEVVGAAQGFLPAETIEVNLLWALSTAPERLEARLCWLTRGKGTEDLEIMDTRVVSEAGAAGKATVSFKLPGRPYSFSGRLVSLVWMVELVAEPVGRSAMAEFVMGPGRKEVLLDAVVNAVSS